MSKDYKVGYGKPPEKTQFAKGKSGNPKGRPKGSKSIGAIVRKQLAGKVSLKSSAMTQGKPKRVSAVEALVMRLVKDAIEGKPKAQSELLKLAQVYLPEEAGTDEASKPVAEEDQKLIDAFVKRMVAKQEREQGDE